MKVVPKYYLNDPLQLLLHQKPKILSSKYHLIAHWSPWWLIPELHSRKGTKFKIKNDSNSMMLDHKPSLAIVYGVAACSKLLTTRVCGLAACHKLSAPSCLILEYLGVCHMVACHNPSQTIVCCLAACSYPSAPRVCHMAACRNPSAPRVCRLAACHFPPPKLEVGTQLCRLDACHFPPYHSCH